MFCDNFNYIYPNTPTLYTLVQTTGALGVQTFTLSYKIMDGTVFLSMPPLSGTATSTATITLSTLPSSIRPTSEQEDLLHVLDAANVKVGTATVSIHGVITVYNVSNTGGTDTFKSNSVAGWNTTQVLKYIL